MKNISDGKTLSILKIVLVLKSNPNIDDIKNVLLKDEIDGIPMMVYISDYDCLKVVTYYKGATSRKSGIRGFSLKDNKFINDPNYYDNFRNHRVVYSFAEHGKSKLITVNGKHVTTKEIEYTYKGKKYKYDFWYIVLDKDKDNFKVRNTINDYDFKDGDYHYINE